MQWFVEWTKYILEPLYALGNLNGVSPRKMQASELSFMRFPNGTALKSCVYATHRAEAKV